jgi:uncharacterized membrane protein YbjE (DUF340 family)
MSSIQILSTLILLIASHVYCMNRTTMIALANMQYKIAKAERDANEKLKEDVYVQGTAIKLFGVVGAVVLVGVTMLLVRRWRNAPQQAVELRLPPLPR